MTMYVSHSTCHIATYEQWLLLLILHQKGLVLHPLACVLRACSVRVQKTGRVQERLPSLVCYFLHFISTSVIQVKPGFSSCEGSRVLCVKSGNWELRLSAASLSSQEEHQYPMPTTMPGRLLLVTCLGDQRVLAADEVQSVGKACLDFGPSTQSCWSWV